MIAPLKRIPAPAFILGWLGVLPFAAGALAPLASQMNLPRPPLAWLAGYGAIILSFMGGVQWGFAAAGRGWEAGGWRGYAASVLPALLGWASLALPVRACLGVVAGGFALLLAYDVWTTAEGEAPAWYGRLRLQLSLAVIACLAAGVAAPN